MQTMMVFAILSLFLLTSCGKSSNQNTNTDNPNEEVPVEEFIPPVTSTIDKVITYCSKLDFSNMPVPADTSVDEINSWTLALNISGSFEGHSGWINITNNFDGQGLSMGLLNQTLGTGSLQPLLIKMHQAAPKTLKAQFEINRYKSLIGMMDAWSSTDIIPAFSDSLIQPNDMPLNEKDIGSDENFVRILGSTENQASVNWAVKTIYTDTAGKNFKPEWKKELQSLLGTSQYRSTQLDASFKLHDKALRYMTLFNFENLNSYLFNFDIVVQNGGFYEKNITEFNAFMQQNPNATEDQKLFALLKSRLNQVKSKYREDVRLRKTALINGQGKVHGTTRNFRTEYCY